MIQIIWTAANLEEARKVARALLEKRWVACANIIPFVESIYIWEEKVETAQEVKVFFKTREEKYSLVKEYIQANCSYDIPEISKLIIDESNPSYEDWILKSVVSNRST